MAGENGHLYDLEVLAEIGSEQVQGIDSGVIVLITSAPLGSTIDFRKYILSADEFYRILPDNKLPEGVKSIKELVNKVTQYNPSPLTSIIGSLSTRAQHTNINGILDQIAEKRYKPIAKVTPSSSGPPPSIAAMTRAYKKRTGVA